MKKLLLIALCSLSAMQTTSAEEAQNTGFVPPYMTKNFEGEPAMPVRLVAIYTFLNDLHELVFLNDCTEEQAIDFIKKAMQEHPELFEPWLQLYTPTELTEAKSGWINIVDKQIKSIKDIDSNLARFEQLPEAHKTHARRLVCEESKWLKGRMKVILSLFKKAGCKPIQEQSEN